MAKTTRKKTARKPAKRNQAKKTSLRTKRAPAKKKSQRYIRLEEATVHEIYARHATKKTTDGFAIAAFVSGLLGLLWPLSIAAIVLGIIAIHNIHKDRRRKGHGLAVLGMLFGLLWLIFAFAADVVSLGLL